MRYKPVILVTGASSGLGLALAELLCNYPEYRIAITARGFSQKKLRDKFQESDTLKIFELDITSEKSRSKCLRNIKQLWGDIDILINNAGISYRSVVEHMTEEDENLQMTTNYFGPMALIRDILPSMREKGRGKIINVSSVSGMLAMPTMASYSASKHALEGASEALWYEMKPYGINVSLIQPGFIRSNSFHNVYFSEKSDPEKFDPKSPYSDYYLSMGPFVEKLMKLSLSTPEIIARKILQTIQTENPPLWVPVTIDAVIFYYLRKFIPRRWLMPVLFLMLPKSSAWALEHTHRRDEIGLANKNKKAS